MAKPELINKYLYCARHPYYIRFMGLLGVLTSVLGVYGLTRYFNLSIWYWILFGPFAFIFLYNRVTRYSLQMFYPKFDVEKHEKFIKDFWNTNSHPTVDVFLPWAGEDLAIFNKTLIGVQRLRYPDGKKKVYVLDDKGDADLEALVKTFGFNYLSRPNKGQFRKSGNLQFGYDNSDSEFVFVLDADFVPDTLALVHIIPYMVSDSTIGILQTPQYFEQTKGLHKESHIQFGGGNVVEDFYRLDMPSRDRVKAALCVGTSALYRRKAILEAGGTPKVWGTEDVRQGLKITRVGYHVKYIPVIISIGDSPDTIQGYFRQHNRWCTGSMATIFGPYFLKAKLNPLARLSYITNATYYLAEAGSVIFSFHLLGLLYFQSASLALINSLWFIPYLLFTHIMVPFSRVHKPKFGTYVAAFSNIFAYFYTLPNIPLGRLLPWEPAGLKHDKVHKSYNRSVNLGFVITLTYIVLLFCILVSDPQLLNNYNAYPVLGWSMYTGLWYILFLFFSIKFVKEIRLYEMENEDENWRYLKTAFLHTKHYLLPVAGLSFVIFILLVYIYKV